MGGGGSHADKYEAERIGVSRRGYGKLAANSIQSRTDYLRYKEMFSRAGKTQEDFQKQDPRAPGAAGSISYGDDTEAYATYLASNNGATYDSTYKRWKMADGTDMQSALTDWNNYEGERKEIATNTAKNERRKAAPKDLSGTSGNVDYTLSVGDQEEEDGVGGAIKGDETESLATSSQTLGVY